MEPNTIKKLIEAHIPGAKAEVDGDGYHFEAVVVAEQFIGQPKVKQNQLVYEVLNPLIKSGQLHAISLKTLTPEQSKRK